MKTKLLLILTLTGCFLCGNIFAAANLGSAFVSNVTSGANCVQSTTNGGGIQFWDIQAGGTYTVTLTGVTDCASQGNESTIGVIVHNSTGGNIYVVANYLDVGVYTFNITLDGQCLTMPIEYCTHNSAGLPFNQPGTGKFAQDAPGGVAGGHAGHLRTSTFDAGCTNPVGDSTCLGGTTPTPPPTASITASKYYDKNANGVQDTGEPAIDGWPFCIDPLDGGTPALVTQLTSGGSVTWSNLTVPAEYTVNEANANESNWFHSTDTSWLYFPPAGGNETHTFGNYCTSPSGGLTLGFWSNKNGNKLLTGNAAGTGTTLLPAVVTLLNSCQMRNANGTLHTFTNVYSAFRTWLLSATATNMAYMLSAQLVALKLDVNFSFVDGNAFDLCSNSTVNGLMSSACDTLHDNGYTPAGDPSRLAQESLKNCTDAINNNGAVVPVTPCARTFPNPPAPCP